jgi:AsmA-like C-terminal region
MVPLRLAGALSFGLRTATSADMVLDGEANGASVKLSARLDGANDGWRKGPAELTGFMEGPDAGKLVVALLGSGGALGRDGAGAGRIVLEAAGVPAEGLTTIASVEAADVAFAFRGQAVSTQAGSSIAGDLEIKGADGTGLAALVGLAPPLKFDDQPVSGNLKVKVSQQGLQIDRFALRLGGVQVQGHMALSSQTPRRRVEAHVDVDAISLSKLLAPLVDQRFAVTGAAEAAVTGASNPWTDAAFNMSPLDRLEGTVNINAKRLELAEGMGLGDATLEVVLDGAKVDVRQIAGSGLGGRFTARLGLDKTPGGAEFTGSLAFDAKLEALGATAPGVARASGPVTGTLEFSGRGTSPRGLLSVLQGKGKLEFGDAKLANLWPGAIAAAITQALKVDPEKMSGELKQGIAEALGNGFLPLGPATVALEIADGQLRTEPLTFDTEPGRTTGGVSLDLRTLTFDSEWRLEQKRSEGDAAQKTALPGVTVSYRGPVAAVTEQVARVNTDAIERELSVRRMERDVEELERVRRQDEERRRSDAWRPRDTPEATRPEVRPATPPAAVPFSPLLSPPRAQPAAPG